MMWAPRGEVGRSGDEVGIESGEGDVMGGKEVEVVHGLSFRQTFPLADHRVLAEIHFHNTMEKGAQMGGLDRRCITPSSYILSLGALQGNGSRMDS